MDRFTATPFLFFLKKRDGVFLCDPNPSKVGWKILEGVMKKGFGTLLRR